LLCVDRNGYVTTGINCVHVQVCGFTGVGPLAV